MTTNDHEEELTVTYFNPTSKKPAETLAHDMEPLAPTTCSDKHDIRTCPACAVAYSVVGRACDYKGEIRGPGTIPPELRRLPSTTEPSLPARLAPARPRRRSVAPRIGRR